MKAQIFNARACLDPNFNFSLINFMLSTLDAEYMWLANQLIEALNNCINEQISAMLKWLNYIKLIKIENTYK